MLPLYDHQNVLSPIYFSSTKAIAKEKVEAQYWIFPVRRVLEIFASLMCCSQSVKQVNTRGHLVSERWLVKVNTGGTCSSNPPTPDRGPMPTSSTTLLVKVLRCWWDWGQPSGQTGEGELNSLDACKLQGLLTLRGVRMFPRLTHMHLQKYMRPSCFWEWHQQHGFNKANSLPPSKS